MLQRVQSLFLLGVVVCMSITSVLPVWQYENTKMVMGQLIYSDMNGGILGQLNMIYLLAISVTAGIIALINVFKYKNRALQIKVAMLNSMLIIVYMVLAFLFIPKQANALMNLEIEGIHFSVGYYLTPLALLCNILARVFIKKDEALVRLVDRLR